MIYVIPTVIGFLGGMFCLYIAMEKRRLRLGAIKAHLHAHEQQLTESVQAFKADRHQADEAAANRERGLADRELQLQRRMDTLGEQEKALNSRVVSYKELQDENVILKRDVRNLEMERRKQVADGETRDRHHEAIGGQVSELCSVYLKDNVKWVSASLNANNFSQCKQRLLSVIARCRAIGGRVDEQEENGLIASLRTEYEKAVRAAFEREEQQRIKAQIREDQIRQREIDRQREQLERETAAIRAALGKAVSEATEASNAEIEHLKAQLKEAEEKQRAISQAQLTRAGHVYVISNIGSFGTGVFKIGMTRRLDPVERVSELGGASVPFPFDVHAMISADDAPKLEATLHQKLHKFRINRANPRKEFFKTEMQEIARIVKENHGEFQYVADAEALQYHQSLTMPEEDQEYIEKVYSAFDDDEDLAPAGASA